MRPLTEQCHDLLRGRLQPGDVAVDATAGNGHDTLFLASCVGPEGHVYAFDIQQDALDRTAERLKRNGLTNVSLIRTDHAHLTRHVPAEHHGRLAAVVFNLGYLPGGDKSITTRTESTLTAIDAALAFLAPTGIVTVLAYPGHAEGRAESVALIDHLQRLPDGFAFREWAPQPDRPQAPRLFLIEPKPPAARADRSPAAFAPA